jgi:hypothetical protein
MMDLRSRPFYKRATTDQSAATVTSKTHDAGSGTVEVATFAAGRNQPAPLIVSGSLSDDIGPIEKDPRALGYRDWSRSRMRKEDAALVIEAGTSEAVTQLRRIRGVWRRMC